LENSRKEAHVLIALSALLVAACIVPAFAKLRSHPKMQASAGHFGIPWAPTGSSGSPSWPLPRVSS
jgi:hypothetical protein